MACRGVHFALTDEEVRALRAIPDAESRVDFLGEEIETRYFNEARPYLAESDKAWDAMHRALADGFLTWDGGDYPLNHVVLGGELLGDEDGYVMSLKTPEQVRDVAAALADVTEDEFRRRYFAIDPADYEQGTSEEDFGYTREWFQEVRRLFAKAAEEGRHVLFSVDQ